MDNVELSPREEQAVNEAMPATTASIAEQFDINHTTVWDIVANLRRKGLNVVQDGEGRYYVPELHSRDTPIGSSQTKLASESKAKITREARDFLSEMEEALEDELAVLDEARTDIVRRDGNQDIIIPRGDDHFGQQIENASGNVIFNSEIAERRVERIFDEVHKIREIREDMGTEFDTAHLILGGDIVTNESIYEGQAYEIDETLREQISRASRVYSKEIKRLSDAFPTVQVVATPGNHGEIRSSNPSNGANADTILYDNLDRLIRTSDAFDNVQFVQSARPHFVNFTARDWNVHVRHGHGASLEHIGTSAGKQRWATWKNDHDFDIAFRFHYHMLKEEPIYDAPVFMGGTIVPQSQFEESVAISGNSRVAIHGATDAQPDAWTERISFA